MSAFLLRVVPHTITSPVFSRSPIIATQKHNSLCFFFSFSPLSTGGCEGMGRGRSGLPSALVGCRITQGDCGECKHSLWLDEGKVKRIQRTSNKLNTPPARLLRLSTSAFPTNVVPSRVFYVTLYVLHFPLPVHAPLVCVKDTFCGDSSFSFVASSRFHVCAVELSDHCVLQSPANG